MWQGHSVKVILVSLHIFGLILCGWEGGEEPWEREYFLHL
jgi:hypothetical protein